MGVVVDAIGQALAHWPLLLLPVLGQFAHELTHFAVARRLGAEPIIRIRLRTPMSVVYDDSSLSTMDKAWIGLAPTLAGLTAACAWVIAYGWPTITPTAVAVGVGWVLYTIPSQADTEPAGKLASPPGGWNEPQRSFLIGLAAMGVAAWIPAVPYPPTYTTPVSFGIIFGAFGYMALAVIEHGMPKDALLAD